MYIYIYTHVYECMCVCVFFFLIKYLNNNEVISYKLIKRKTKRVYLTLLDFKEHICIRPFLTYILMHIHTYSNDKY